jgi:hypothetical protein
MRDPQIQPENAEKPSWERTFQVDFINLNSHRKFAVG